jgi:hypothetical protein
MAGHRDRIRLERALAIAARKNALALAASKGWRGHISRSLESAMHAPREGAIVNSGKLHIEPLTEALSIDRRRPGIGRELAEIVADDRAATLIIFALDGELDRVENNV